MLGVHLCADHRCLLCREVKRLSAVTLSPIYAHFTETLTGLQVIRAFRHGQRFARENEERLEANQRAFYACKLLHKKRLGRECRGPIINVLCC